MNEAELHEARRSFNRLWHDFLNNGFGNWEVIEDHRMEVFEALRELGVNERRINWLIRERAPREADWTREIRLRWFEGERERRQRLSRNIHDSNRFQGRLHDLGVALGFDGWNRWGIFWAIEQSRQGNW